MTLPCSIQVITPLIKVLSPAPPFRLHSPPATSTAAQIHRRSLALTWIYLMILGFEISNNFFKYFWSLLCGRGLTRPTHKKVLEYSFSVYLGRRSLINSLTLLLRELVVQILNHFLVSLYNICCQAQIFNCHFEYFKN